MLLFVRLSPSVLSEHFSRFFYTHFSHLFFTDKGFPELRPPEYTGIGNYERFGIFRGNFHSSSSVVPQDLELVEGWKFGRGELSEVLLYRYIEEEYIKKSKLIPDLRTMNIEG